MQGKYHLLSITIILSIIYAISYAATKIGIIKKNLHSKIWNSALLVSFLVTGLSGVCLVILINNKIEVAIFKDITFFHVDFGISLFFISVFHILLHIKYFINLLNASKIKKAGTLSEPDENAFKSNSIQKWKILYSIIVLGVTSIITQIVFIREFVSAFNGNELLIGIIISIWLILTGTGAFSACLASKIKATKRTLWILQALLGVLPFITVFLLPVFKNLFFPAGLQVNYVQLIVFAFLLLLPFCFVSGFMFTFLSKLLSSHFADNKVYVNYSLESLGSLAGGFLFSFILVFFFRSFQTLGILLLINIISILFSVHKNLNLFVKIIISIIILCCSFIVFYINFDNISKAYLFQSQRIISINQSPYGQLVLTENSGQLNFFQNGNYLFSSDSDYSPNANIAADEETVHFAMLQHPNPQSILSISGGIGGSIYEMLKYPVKSIDYIEIDPIISKMAIKYNTNLISPKVKIINQDAREYLNRVNKKYDVLFVDVPPPSGTETNRFYTDEFFKILKQSMTGKSVLSICLPPSVNYFEEYALLGNRVIYNTLSNNFKYVKIFPGEKNYFLASGIPLNSNMAEKITERGIENEYIAYYLDDLSLTARSNQMLEAIKGKSAINRDTKPVSYLLYIKQQWSIFSGSYWILGVVVLLFIVLSFARLNKVRFGMFAAGFASIFTELTIVYLFQMVFGNAYQSIGIVITVFMAGLVVGPLLPLYSGKHSISRIYSLALFSEALLILLFPWLFKLIIDNGAGRVILYLVFFLNTFLVAGFTGYIFKLASMLVPDKAEKIAGDIYSADLFGSAFGALLVSILIIPLFGLVWSGLPGFILCLVSVLLILKMNP
jgi:spermidine synthase